MKCLLKKWKVLTEMKDILNLPYLSTVMLQNKDFTLSDFLGCFKIMDMKLNQIITNDSVKKYTTLASNLQSCLNQRKSKLLDNPLSLCAAFLDPRYKCEIDRDQDKMRFVEMTLEHLWDKMRSVNDKEQAPVKEASTTVNTSGDMSSLFDELDNHYRAIGVESGSLGENMHRRIDHPDFSRNDISIQISKYEQATSTHRMKSSESIHDYWNTRKNEFGPELREIADVVFAIPPTQAAVERCFSALKFLFTEQRCNLGEELLECLMLVHLNPDFFESVKEQEIKDLEDSLKLCH